MNSPAPGLGHPARHHLNYVEFAVELNVKTKNTMDQVVMKDLLSINMIMYIKGKIRG